MRRSQVSATKVNDTHTGSNEECQIHTIISEATVQGQKNRHQRS